MARIRELLAAQETRQTEILERMDALQTRLDLSPGQAAMTQIQEEMTQLRQQLAATETELANLKATLPPNQNPDAPDDTNQNVPAITATPAAQPARKRPAVKDWH